MHESCFPLTYSSYNASVFQIARFNEFDVFAIEYGSPEWNTMDSDNATWPKFNRSSWRTVYDTKYVAEHGDLYLVIDRLGFDLKYDWMNVNLSSSNSSHFFPLRFNNSDQEHLRILTEESSDWIQYDKFFLFDRGYPIDSVYNVTTNDTSQNVSEISVSDSWPVSAHVDHAFSQSRPAMSRLQLSLTYILVVITCNVLKLSVMIWTLIIDRSTYIVTMGDSIASFLQRPDLITRHNCALGKEETLYKLGYMPYHEPEGEALDTLALRVDGMWLPDRRRYFALMGQDRQVFFALL
jgi:hypothetical protein